MAGKISGSRGLDRAGDFWHLLVLLLLIFIIRFSRFAKKCEQAAEQDPSICAGCAGRL